VFDAVFLLAAAQPPAVAAAPEPQQLSVYDAAYFAPYNPQTAMDMIGRLPGFSFDPGANIRGFAGAEGNVRIDGELPASRGDSVGDILRRMPAAAVERIELITGAVEGVDLQGRTLVANVIRKPGVGAAGSARVSVGRFEDGRVSPNVELQAQRNTGLRLYEGSLFFSDDLDGGVGPRVRGLTSPVTTWWDAEGRYNTLGASGAVESPFAGGRLRLNSQVSAVHNRGVQRDLSAPGLNLLPSVERTERDASGGEFGARYSRELENGLAIQLVGFQQIGESELAASFAQGSASSLFSVDRTSGETILRATARAPRMGRWNLDGGIEGAFNWLNSESAYEQNGTPIPLPAGKVRVQELRGELFGTAAWTPTDKLTLQTGLRVEGSDIESRGAIALEKTLSYVKPRVVLNWRPAAGHLAVFRVERVVGQLDFGQFSATASLTNGTIVAGNPDLEPEESTVFEARYERRFGQQGSFVVRATREQIDNLISRVIFLTPGGAYDAPGNAGEARLDVLTLSASLPLDKVGVPGGLLSLAAGFTNSEMTDPITGEKRELSGIADADYRVGFIQEFGGGKYRWGFDYYETSKTFTYLPFEVDSAVGEPLVYVHFQHQWRDDVTVRIEGVNLLDRDWTTTREVYDGLRDTGSVVFRERRDLSRSLGGRGIVVRLRKQFG
jgi:hypothetical protein